MQDPAGRADPGSAAGAEPGTSSPALDEAGERTGTGLSQEQQGRDRTRP